MVPMADACELDPRQRRASGHPPLSARRRRPYHPAMVPPPDKPIAPPAERPARTQVLVAALGLAGVLGASLLSNWDKVFGPSAPGPSSPTSGAAPAAGSQGAQSAAVSGVTGNVTILIGEGRTAPVPDLSGRWETPTLTSAYDPNGRFTLVFDLEMQGTTVLGTVTTRTETPRAGTFSRMIVDGRVEGTTISFATPFETVLGSTARPSLERYVGRLEGGEIRFRRANDVPTGGMSETFTARRSQ